MTKEEFIKIENYIGNDRVYISHLEISKWKEIYMDLIPR